MTPLQGALPEIVEVAPLRGVTLGADLLRVRVRHAAPQLAVAIDARPAAPSARVDAPPESVLWLPLPPRRREDALRIVVQNLSQAGVVLPMARAEWDGCVLGVSDAAITGKGQLAQITRALIGVLGSYAATSARFAHVVDLDTTDGVRMVPVGDGPALTISGPRPELARIASVARPTVVTVLTADGTQRIERTTGVSLDLLYEVTGAARNGAELLALLAGVATFLARTRWLELPRDPRTAHSPLVRWDLDADGAFQSQITAGVHTFRVALRVRNVVTSWPELGAS